MKLHNLRDFITVAEAGSLRAAARKLNLAQPSLTKSIQQLEKDLGTSLFERNARGATLTDAGKTFLLRAEAALNELRRGQDEINQLREAKGGKVAIGLSSTPSLILLADVMKTFRQDFPDASVRIIPGTFPVMFPELRAGRLDFSIGPRSVYTVGEEYLVEKLFKTSRVIVCRKDHPLRNARRLGELVDAEWLITDPIGQPDSDHERLFFSHGLPVPRAVVNCDYLTAILALVSGTDILTMLPRQWVYSSITGGLLEEIKVAETLPEIDLVMIRKSGLPLTPAAEHFLTLIRRYIGYCVETKCQSDIKALLPADRDG